jgi:ComEC/Rec2-related protein
VFDMSFSRLSGYLASAFLTGIVLHSTSPYVRLSQVWLITGIGISFVLAIVLYQDQRLHPSTISLYLPPLTLAFILIGVLRFSLVQPSLPRGLIFANPKGLAASIEADHTANRLDPRHWLRRFHLALTKRARERFLPDEAALITGILYGDRDLSKGAKTAFRHAGMTHIIAVSGSNMTIIVVLITRCLSLFHLSRRQSFWGMVIAVALFTVFVGASAAVVRAAIMGLLVEAAPLVGRLIRPSRLLLLSAVAFTVWHPWALVFDPSFALSFLAMTGLLTFGRLLDVYLLETISLPTLREIVVSTLAATLLTTPYSAWAFGSLTLWGLPTGLIVLPLIPWTMAFGTLALILPDALLRVQVMSFTLQEGLLLPATGCLRMILLISRWPEYVRRGFWDKTYLTFGWCLITYLLLWVGYKNIHNQKKQNRAVRHVSQEK